VPPTSQTSTVTISLVPHLLPSVPVSQAVRTAIHRPQLRRSATTAPRALRLVVVHVNATVSLEAAIASNSTVVAHVVGTATTHHHVVPPVLKRNMSLVVLVVMAWLYVDDEFYSIPSSIQSSLKE